MRTFWCGCALMVCAGAVSADVIISNLDGNDGSQSADLDALRVKGMGFTMPAGDDWTMDFATIRLRANGAGIEPIVQIWSDVGGAPDAVIDTLVNPSFADSGIVNYEFEPSGSVTLEAGATYWLIVYGTGVGSTFDWMASSPAQTPTGVATHAGALFDTDGPPPGNNSSILNSYSINATLVPAPSSLALLGLGVLAARRRR